MNDSGATGPSPDLPQKATKIITLLLIPRGSFPFCSFTAMSGPKV